MRLVFMGTPEFAVPSLRRIVAVGHEVLTVYTQPDRPKGRGGQVTASPIKDAALSLGLSVSQPERIRREPNVSDLRALHPEAMVVVGYGQIIPQSIIDIPPAGIINVHASLLPKYRGAAPIQWAIANGEATTGVTTMRIDAGLDTGDTLLKSSMSIGPEENALELSPRLAEAGAELLVETLAGLQVGIIQPQPQDSLEATLAPILKKEDGAIDWSWPAATVFNRSRGLLPWPGTYTTFRGQHLHIWKTRPTAEPAGGRPGRLHAEHKRLFVACGGGTALEVLELQIQGRKRVPAEAFLAGHRLTDNEFLGETIA
jgi:methionyl-tRNA formyltransferase